jgi:hypothetical protein
MFETITTIEADDAERVRRASVLLVDLYAHFRRKPESSRRLFLGQQQSTAVDTAGWSPDAQKSESLVLNLLRRSCLEPRNEESGVRGRARARVR